MARKRSASGGEPPQFPGWRRRCRCRHCGHAAGSECRDAGDPAEAEPPRLPSALPPKAHVAAAETGTPKELPRIGGVAGSDFMVDVIKTLDIKYLPSQSGLELPRASTSR